MANADDMLMLCVQVKKSLSVAYGRFPGYTFDKLSTDKLRRKLAFCREVRDCTRRVFSFSFIILAMQVLEFVTILEPGLSTQKGLTLYELWQVR